MKKLLSIVVSIFMIALFTVPALAVDGDEYNQDEVAIAGDFALTFDISGVENLKFDSEDLFGKNYIATCNSGTTITCTAKQIAFVEGGQTSICMSQMKAGDIAMGKTKMGSYCTALLEGLSTATDSIAVEKGNDIVSITMTLGANGVGESAVINIAVYVDGYLPAGVVIGDDATIPVDDGYDKGDSTGPAKKHIPKGILITIGGIVFVSVGGVLVKVAGNKKPEIVEEEDYQTKVWREEEEEKDRKFIEKAREDNNKVSQIAKDWSKEKHELEVKQRHDAFKDKMSMKYGTEEGDDMATKKAINLRNADNEIRSAEAHGRVDYIQAGLETAADTVVAADIGVDTLASFTGEAGKTVKSAYIAGKEYGSATVEVLTGQKDAASAYTQATVNTAVGVADTHAGDFGQKMVTKIGGEAAKSVTKAALDGKDIDGIIDALEEGKAKGEKNLIMDTFLDEAGVGEGLKSTIMSERPDVK